MHGTPETHDHANRQQQGALARLYEAGTITLDQLAAGAGIASVHARIASDVAIGTMSLETRVDVSRSGDGSFFERLGAVRAEIAYGEWRRGCQRPDLVLAIVVDECGLVEAARRFRMHNRRARRLLLAGLDLWSEAIGDAVDRVDELDLLLAHARIA